MTQPNVIASRYRILRELGRGGMGVVYLVEHIHTGDHLALKLLLGKAALDVSAVERFKREARASARIKSENVVKVVDADTAPELDGAPFLVMELLNGSDLQKHMDRGRLPPADVLKYLTEAARALDKSHAMGIVHRDLKPENLFLHSREDGTVTLKILDFGISKIVGGDANNDMTGAGMTNTGSVMGTPLYMSPEQARGRVDDIGPATDVWAMGLIAVHLLVGEIYWQANTVGELMVQILSEPLYEPTKRWPWLPPAFDAWFARSCARDHKQRFARVGEQMEALRAAFSVRGPSALAPSPELAVALAPTAHSEAPANAPTAYASTAFAGLPASHAPIAGARTTTSAVASEHLGPGAPATRPRFAIATVIMLLLSMTGGGAAWLGRSRAVASQSPLTATSFASGVVATASSVQAPSSSAADGGATAGAAASANPPSASPSASARSNPAGRKWPAPSAAPSSTTAPAVDPKKPFAPAGL